ncbi:MAG: hypothetical protein ACKVUT_01490 [Gaiella sp.]
MSEPYPRYRAAGVWRKDDGIYVETMVFGTRESGILPRPRFHRRLDVDASAVEIGCAVVDALNANYVDPDLPEYPTDIRDTVYAAGHRTYRSFNRGALYVDVFDAGDHLSVSPSDGSKRAGAFMFSTDQLRVEGLDPGAIGKAVLEAFERSTPGR